MFLLRESVSKIHLDGLSWSPGTLFMKRNKQKTIYLLSKPSTQVWDE